MILIQIRNGEKKWPAINLCSATVWRWRKYVNHKPERTQLLKCCSKVDQPSQIYLKLLRNKPVYKIISKSMIKNERREKVLNIDLAIKTKLLSKKFLFHIKKYNYKKYFSSPKATEDLRRSVCRSTTPMAMFRQNIGDYR